MNPMYMRWGHHYRGTPAELALEDEVAALGVPYRTQFPYFLFGERFFPDFLLPTLGLVIEVDDKSHSTEEKKLSDAERTKTLGEHGWKVVRCTNEEALTNPRGAVNRMLREARLWPVPETLPKIRECLPRPKKLREKQLTKRTR